MSFLLTASTAASSTAKPVSAFSLFLQLMIGLAVVLGLIWVGSRVMRGRMGKLNGRRRSAPLSVVGRQALGKGVQLAIVRVGAELYLLGVTAHQVTRLARLRPEELDVIESSDDLPPAAAATPFPSRAGRPLPATPPAVFRLQSTIRQMQERTLRRS